MVPLLAFVRRHKSYSFEICAIKSQRAIDNKFYHNKIFLILFKFCGSRKGMVDYNMKIVVSTLKGGGGEML